MLEFYWFILRLNLIQNFKKKSDFYDFYQQMFKWEENTALLNYKLYTGTINLYIQTFLDNFSIGS